MRNWRLAGIGMIGALSVVLSGCSSSSAPAAEAGEGCQFRTHADAETRGGKKPDGANDPVIKGYILSGSNDKVYYVPGAQAYKRAKIDESKGMKFFCSEAEAQAAGWKKATV